MDEVRVWVEVEYDVVVVVDDVFEVEDGVEEEVVVGVGVGVEVEDNVSLTAGRTI